MNKILPFLFLVITGCSSTKMVENWKNPDIVLFPAYQVLIVGMAQNQDTQYDFETKLQKEFEARKVEAMRSIDLFDVKFTDSAKSEEELSDVEEQLLEKGFDAILLTKVVGAESERTFNRKMTDLSGYYEKFSQDYMDHQSIYLEADYNDLYPVYYTETSLYCICPGKERELIWRGSMQITHPKNPKKTVDDYIKLVVKTMEEKNLIFRAE